MVSISPGTACTTQAGHRDVGGLELTYPPTWSESANLYTVLGMKNIEVEHMGLWWLCVGVMRNWHAQIAKGSGRTLPHQFRQDQAGSGELTPTVTGMSSSPLPPLFIIAAASVVGCINTT